MLINKCEIKVQRHQDSLFFNIKKHCDQSRNILTNNAIHFVDKGVIIYLNEDESKKLEVFIPLVQKCTLQQLENISCIFVKSTTTTIANLLLQSFNKNCGWFFKNGNK